MNFETISYLNQNIKLMGTLYKPDGDGVYPAVIVVHPASGGEQTDPFYDHLKSVLPNHGIAVLVYDRRGSGDSQGDFETADFYDLAGDVVAAVEYLESRADIDAAKIGLHGTSQGAWVVPVAAAKKPEIACVVAVSASGVTPADQMHFGVAFHRQQDGYDLFVIGKVIELRTLVNEYFRGHLTKEYVAGKLALYESESWFKKAYLYASQNLPVDIAHRKWHFEMDYEPLSIWSKVNQPTLFLFAETDEWVPVEAGMKNYEAASSHINDVTIHRIAGTNHLMSVSDDEDVLDISNEYIEVLLNWLISKLVT